MRAKANARKKELRAEKRALRIPGGNLACGDQQGTTTGYARHQETGDLSACEKCSLANAKRSRNKRSNETEEEREKRRVQNKDRMSGYMEDPVYRAEHNRITQERRKADPEKYNKRQRELRHLNKEKLTKEQNKLRRERYKNDPEYRAKTLGINRDRKKGRNILPPSDECACCGTKDFLEKDHIVPYSKGGETDAFNIQMLCRACNSSKSDGDTCRRHGTTWPQTTEGIELWQKQQNPSPISRR